MKRTFISYRGNSVAVPVGDFFIGRGLSCAMRLNDVNVSRKHVRISLNEEGQILVQDLGSSNGTKLNGQDLKGSREAKHGDVIKIGSRDLQILKVEESEIYEDDEPTLQGEVSVVEAMMAGNATDKLRQRCPECSEVVSIYDDLCVGCGYSWGHFRPENRTITSHSIVPAPGPDASIDGLVDTLTDGRERRRAARHKVQVPLMYSSDSLAIESHAVDLSSSGVFVRTNLLDPIGTLCCITILVDGAPAINLDGKVCRVVEVDDGGGQPLGLGIQFLTMGAGAQSWLSDALASSPDEL